MTRGQESLVSDVALRPIAQSVWIVVDRKAPIVPRADDTETEPHRMTLA
jgi:hypothetical protein